MLSGLLCFLTASWDAMGRKSVFNKLTDTSGGLPEHVDPSPPEGEEGLVAVGSSKVRVRFELSVRGAGVAPMSHLGQRALDDDVGGRLGRQVGHDGHAPHGRLAGRLRGRDEGRERQPQRQSERGHDINRALEPSHGRGPPRAPCRRRGRSPGRSSRPRQVQRQPCR